MSKSDSNFSVATLQDIKNRGSKLKDNLRELLDSGNYPPTTEDDKEGDTPHQAALALMNSGACFLLMQAVHRVADGTLTSIDPAIATALLSAADAARLRDRRAEANLLKKAFDNVMESNLIRLGEPARGRGASL